jgi:uncharacterized membrane protein YhaH (DUF805 family)
MEWYIHVLKKYAIFSGRARRSEYWYFILFNFLIALIISLLTLLPAGEKIFGIISIGYSLVLIVPSFAVSIRRLHDTNRSGFSLLLFLIPLAGIIILIIYLTQDGTPEENQYGLNPKNENILTKNNKKQKRWLIPLIMLAIALVILFYYFGFKNLSSKEQFGIFNMSNNNYYLNIVSNQSISQFSFKRYVKINGINYYFIIETGQYRLKGARNIFQCERNSEMDIYLKMNDIFSEFNIVDENNNIVWDLYDDNSEKIKRIEHPVGTIFWILSME